MSPFWKKRPKRTVSESSSGPAKGYYSSLKRKTMFKRILLGLKDAVTGILLPGIHVPGAINDNLQSETPKERQLDWIRFFSAFVPILLVIGLLAGWIDLSSFKEVLREVAAYFA